MTNERILVSRNKREGYYAGRIHSKVRRKPSKGHVRVSQNFGFLALDKHIRQCWYELNMLTTRL